MDIQPLSLAGAYAIRLQPHRDDRGYFEVTYGRDEFEKHGLATDWVQDNQSLSGRRGIVRGLHFQRPPHAETKLLRVVAGAVWDVFVDLRKASPTFGRWEAIELSSDNHMMVYIPKGFAHGFCTLTDTAVVAYKVDAFFSPSASAGVRWNDESLAISWPTTDAFLSPRDRELPLLREFESPF